MTVSRNGLRESDRGYLRRALRLATRGIRTTDPNPAVGCVVVRDGCVVGEGWHAFAGGPHAEVQALAAAEGLARGATAYITLEPCSHHGRTPPCAPALVVAGLRRVVVASTDPNPTIAGTGLSLLREAGIETVVGLCADEARRLNRGFFSRHERGRPWITLKLASSLDGRSALASGKSRWITGTVARAAVHRARARASAIMTGVGTVLADDPRLSVRLARVCRQPARVVLDPHLYTRPTAALLREPGMVHLFCLDTVAAPRRAALEAAGARVHPLPPGRDGRPDLAVIFAQLGEMGFNSLYAEAGPRLAGALLAGGWVDELELYYGPHLLGTGALPFAAVADLQSLPEVPPWRIITLQRVGRDARLRLQPEGGRSLCLPE